MEESVKIIAVPEGVDPGAVRVVEAGSKPYNLVFSCELCGGAQPLQYYPNHGIALPLCNECKNNLRELIAERRRQRNNASTKQEFLDTLQEVVNDTNSD